MSKLIIIKNEKISNIKGRYYCDNIDGKSIPEGLSQYFDVEIIGKLSNISNSHEINIENIKISKNIFSYLKLIYKTLTYCDKYLIISLSPFTFFAILLLTFFRKKPYLYLRSDGFKEYEKILGFIGPMFYKLMFSVAALRCQLISCNSQILRGKNGNIVSPSQLEDSWFQNCKKPSLSKINLLYVGRIKIEKGIFYLTDIFRRLDNKINLTILPAGPYNKKKMEQKNINILEYKNTNNSIIEIYDKNNIFILPSYTEGHPQVLDEALARRRPVIIFEDIKHVVGRRVGIFIAKRSPESLMEQINFIFQNYDSIYEKMVNNYLPTKKNFLDQIKSIINAKKYEK
tara:strand:- start:3697 stop:4725 length:1029 start_codon:yes stop_codon:yes gene_type:complete